MLDQVMPKGTSCTRVAFADVVRLSKARSKDPESEGYQRVVGLEHIDPGDLRIRRWADVSDGTTFTTVFEPGQVLFGKRRAYQRKVAVAEFAGVCSGDIYVLEPSSTALMPELLPFICQTDTFFEHAISTSAGSLSPRTNWKSLAECEIELPPPQEQVRLVEALQTAENTYQSLRNLQAAMRTATVSLLDSVFDPVTTREMMKAKLKALPPDWTTLGSITSLQVGFAFKSSGFSKTGDRLLRGSNVAVDATSWAAEETRYWPTELREEHSDYILHDDDIVIAMDRPFITAGFKVARLTRSDLPALLLQRVGRFLADDRRTHDLVWACLHSRAFQYQLLAQQEGTDLPHISRAQIEGVLVHRGALDLSDEIARFTEGWRQGVVLKRRVEEAVEMKRRLIQAVLV